MEYGKISEMGRQTFEMTETLGWKQIMQINADKIYFGCKGQMTYLE